MCEQLMWNGVRIAYNSIITELSEINNSIISYSGFEYLFSLFPSYK